jgi:glycosyltransferase involved in cell wall biosynthesis
MTPLVSLMVPVYNREDLLPPCLDSALAQTWTDLEIVVVDGASTDGTWDVCQRYAELDPRVRIVREDVNGGPVPGWRRCLEEARGSFGTFLWSDDLLRPTFLERAVALLRDDAVAFAFTAAEIGPQPGLGRVWYVHQGARISSRRFIEGSLLHSAPLPVSPACALFRLADLRQAIVDEIPTEPPTDLRSTGAGTDVLFYLLTAIRYPSVACIPEPLAFFRAHPGSVTIQGRGGQVALNYALARAWFAREHGYRALTPRILARHWLREMRTRRRVITPTAAVGAYRGLVNTRELLGASASEIARIALKRALRQTHR